MNLLNKIFLLLIGVLLFWILIYNTYFSEKYTTFIPPYYKNTNIGEYGILEINEKLLLKESSGSGEIKINYLDSFDKILSYKGDIKQSFSGKTKTIELEKGFYLIDFSELNNDYIIKGNGFKINNSGPNSIYIDNSGPRTTILSLNSIIDLELIDTSKGDSVNNLFLYPHKYLIFNPSQNRFVKNADILRIYKSLKLDYFPHTLLHEEKINNNFVDTFLNKNSQKDIGEIEKMFLFISSKNIYNSEVLEELKTENFGTTIGTNLVKKYNKIFLNKKKKTIYYKNLLINILGDLLKTEKIDEKSIRLLLTTLDELKDLNLEDHDEIKDIIKYYCFLVITSDKENSISKINFSQIINALNKKQFNFKNDNNLILNNLFFKYDFYGDKNLFKEILKFNKEETEIEDKNKLSYFIFFLNKLITYSFQDIKNTNDTNIEDLLSIFNDYIKISLEYYSQDDKIKIRTGIEEYNNILKELAISIKKYYFIEPNENDLLLNLNKSVNINLEKIKILEKNIENIFSYFYKKSYILTQKSKDKNISKDFETTKSLYDQYFLAIKDYDKYAVKYEEINKQLIYGDTINIKNNDKEDENLNINKAKSYLNTFNHLDKTFLKISIKDFDYCENPVEKNNKEDIVSPYCYEIKDLIVGDGLKISFLLHPYDYNNITDIEINGDKNINRGSYKLDNEKILLDKKYSKLSNNDDDIEKYLFSNFFLYVFNPPKYISIIENQGENNSIEKQNDSTIIQVFKREKLLGKNGDFNNLSGFIDIKYDDLIVEKINDNYDIKIKNSSLIYNNGNYKYKGKIDSKYIFTPNHSFINPEIVLSDEKDNNILNGNKIILKGEISVIDIKKQFESLIEKLNKINVVFINLKETLGIKEINIEFDYGNQNIKFINNEIEIIINKDTIISINYKGNNIEIENNNIYLINNILETLK